MKIIDFFFICYIALCFFLSPISAESFTETSLPCLAGISIGLACGAGTYHTAQTYFKASKENSLIFSGLACIISGSISTIFLLDFIQKNRPDYKLEKVLGIIATIETDPIVTHDCKTIYEYFNFLHKQVAEEKFLVYAEELLVHYNNEILKALELLCDIKKTKTLDEKTEYFEMFRSIKELQQRLQDLAQEIEQKKNIITTSPLFIKQSKA